MTLTTACTPRVVITGNGTLGPYSLVDASSVAIRLVSTGHLKLTRYAASTDDNNDGTLLVLNTDFTVGGTQDARTFTLIGSQAVLTSSQRIVAERVQNYTQDLDLTTGGSFNATSLESRFDKLAEFQQELKARLDRVPALQFADATANVGFPSPPTSATQVLARNTAGEIVHATAASLDVDVVLGTDWATILGLPAAGTLDNLSGVRFVATYAALTALTTATGLADNAIYYTYARTTEEDGGAGFWRYDSGVSTTANGGTILAINGGGAGRFIRLYRGEVDVRWFGARVDGATNDSAALTAAIAASREVYIPPGVLYLTSHVFVSNIDNWTLRGAGKGLTTIRCSSGGTFTNSALALSACDKVKISGITFDQNNNASFSATRALVIATGGSDTVIRDCEFIKVTYIGLAVSNTTNFLVEGNYCSFDTALSTTSYGINVSSTGGTITANGRVIGNVCSKCTIFVSGYDIEVAGNMCFDYQYGAGVNTSGGNDTASYGQYNIHHNTCTDGSGVDSDGVDVAGIELNGYNCICDANICARNGGTGIASLAPRAIITNNICFGNGVNAGASDANRSGIKLGFADATIGAHNSLLEGNSCFDDGSTRQKYGVYEEGGATLSGVTMIGNKLSGNVTGPVYLQGTSGRYFLDEWIDWVPTVSSQTGTITTVGTVTAKYLRRGPIVHFIVSITITTNGTGGTNVRATVPIAIVNDGISHGRENGVTGYALHGLVTGGRIGSQTYDGLYPGGDGRIINLAGFYGI